MLLFDTLLNHKIKLFWPKEFIEKKFIKNEEQTYKHINFGLNATSIYHVITIFYY